MNLVTNDHPTTGGVDVPDIDIELSLTPPTQGPWWRSIAAYVRWASGFATKRGRNRETDQFQTGDWTVDALENGERVFDPNYSSSPLYGHVKPERRVRGLARWPKGTGTTYVFFDGYADGFEQRYRDFGKDKVASLSAGDAFKVYAQSKAPEGRCAWDLEVLADRPVVWHKLGDFSAGGTMTDSSGNGYSGAYSSGGASITGLVAESSDAAVDFNGTTDYARAATNYNFATLPNAYAFEFWFKTSQVPASRATLMARNGLERVQLSSAGLLKFAEGSPIGLSSAAVNDGLTHHCVYDFDGTTGVLYIDGVSQTTTGAIVTDTGLPPGLLLGGSPSLTNTTFDGAIDEFAFYEHGLGAARVLAHYNAGKAGISGAWGNEDTGARMGRYLDFVPVVASDRDIDSPCSSTCGPQSTFSGTVLDQVLDAANTEAAQTYMGIDGAMSSDDHFRVVHRSRSSAVTATRSSTSQGTFGPNDLQYADVLFDYNEQRIYNEAKVTREGGTEQYAYDTASQVDYFTRTYTKTGLLSASDNDALAHAQWAVDRFADPESRITGLVLKPQRDPDNLYPHALGREIGDRITVKDPTDTVSIVAMIEGVEHSLAGGEWTTVWRLSVADTRAYWILNTSALDTDTRLGF